MEQTEQTDGPSRDPLEHGMTEDTYFQIAKLGEALEGLGLLLEGAVGKRQNGISHVEHLAPTLTCLGRYASSILDQIVAI